MYKFDMPSLAISSITKDLGCGCVENGWLELEEVMDVLGLLLIEIARNGKTNSQRVGWLV